MSILMEIRKYMPENALKVHCACGGIVYECPPFSNSCNKCNKKLPKRYQFYTKYIGARLRYYKNKEKVIINE